MHTSLGLRRFVNVDGGPGFVGGVAERFDWAVDAFGLARDADGAAMMDDLVGEVDPLVARDDLHQVLLDLAGVGVLRKFEAAGDALDVRVNDNTVSDAE